MVEPKRPIRIALVADDDALIRRVMAIALESDGWTALEAADGSATIEMLDSYEIDLCVMDRHMPGPPLESRLELVDRLRPRAGIVVLSGDAHGPHPEGRAVYLAKPVDIQDLRDGVARAMDRTAGDVGSDTP